MRRWLALVFLTASAYAAPVIVQACKAAPGAANSITITCPTAPSSGHVLLACVASSASAGTASSDGTWTMIGSGSGSHTALAAFYKNLIVTPGTSYTFTTSGVDYLSGVVYELSGVGGSPINGYSFVNTYSNGPSTTAVTPSVLYTLPISCETTNQARTPTAVSSGWTVDQYAGNSYHDIQTVYRSTATSDTTNPISVGYSFSNTDESELAMILVAGTGTPGPIAPPTASPAGGTFNVPPSSVTLTLPSGATGCYRLDGNTPTATTAGTCDASSTTYSAPFAIPSGSGSYTVSLKAISTQSGQTNSAVYSQNYVIQPITVVPNIPPMGFAFQAGASRQINVNVLNCTGCNVDWTWSGTGGATMNFGEFNATGVSSLTNALATQQINIGSTGGACTLAGALPNVGGTLAGGSITSPTISGGTGFPPSVTVTATYPGGTTNATATFTTNASGVASGTITLVSGGSGYTSVPAANAIQFNYFPYSVSSPAMLTITAKAHDDTTKIGTFTIPVCTPDGTTYVSPFYQPIWKGGSASLQSWVMDPNDLGTWSITSQPTGGDGAFQSLPNAPASACGGNTATGCRDAAFTATVQGRYTLKYTSASNSANSASAIVYVASTVSPAYSSLPDKVTPTPWEIDPALTGTIYEVGVGKTYATIQAVPDNSTWTPGTTLRIWNTDTTGSSPSTFHEIVQLASTGTPTQPVTMVGVPDSQGHMPIIDGQGATTQANANSYIMTVAAGPVFTYAREHSIGCYGGFIGGSCGPSYVNIRNLRIQNSETTNTFSFNGSTLNYPPGSACITTWSGSNIFISGVACDHTQNGFFTTENSNNLWAAITTDIYIANTAVTNWGVSGVQLIHANYLQSPRLVRETSYSDAGIAGSQTCSSPVSTTQACGNNLKWRGAGGIFRYSYDIAGAGHVNDMPDIQDPPQYFSFEDYYGYYGNQGSVSYTQAMATGFDSSFTPNNLVAYQQLAYKDLVYGNIYSSTEASGEVLNHYDMDHPSSMTAKLGRFLMYNTTWQLQNGAFMFSTAMTGNYTILMPQQFYVANNDMWAGGYLSMNAYQTYIGQHQTNRYPSGFISLATPINASQAGWTIAVDNNLQWPNSLPLDAHQFTSTGAAGFNSSDFLSAASQPFSSSTFAPLSSGGGSALTGPAQYMPVRRYYQPESYTTAAKTQPLTLGARDSAAGLPGLLFGGRLAIGGKIR